VEEIQPRQVELLRPPVVNIDQVVIVAAAANPPPDMLQVDRLLCLAGRLGVPAVVCLNKVDLAEAGQVEAALTPYRTAGYPALGVSARTGEGVAGLQRLLAGKVSVLAGRSGVGKTALSNQLVPGREAATGEVSQRLRQGRHTTRHAELLPLQGGGLLADTPGFSAFEDVTVTPAEVAESFPEYARLANECRFRGCQHDQEPGCAAKAAVASGALAQDRYERYLTLLREARQHRQW
jgi:ribosome biogenesis GTPase